MSTYDSNKIDEYIVYLDANNLYGYAMSQYLPQKKIKWNKMNKWNEEKIMQIPDNNNIGYTFEVDLEYPENLHNYHNNYPLAPENIQIKVKC